MTKSADFIRYPALLAQGNSFPDSKFLFLSSVFLFLCFLAFLSGRRLSSVVRRPFVLVRRLAVGCRPVAFIIMFPYFHLLYFAIGPIKIYTWGLFVSLGFLVAFFALRKKFPEDKNIFLDILLYVILGSMFGARLFYILFYSGDIFGELAHFFAIWRGGMSSFGGFFGGALALYAYSRVKKISFYELASKAVFALPLGLAMARIGCYLINDHPGKKTGFNFLAVGYPDGARFDLGFLLLFFNLAIFSYFLLKKGNFLEKFLIIYGAGRFLLDFLREGEPVFAGLIPSQYGSIVMLLTGLILTNKNMKLVDFKFNPEKLKSEKLTKILFFVFAGLLVVNHLLAAYILLFKKLNG